MQIQFLNVVRRFLFLVLATQPLSLVFADGDHWTIDFSGGVHQPDLHRLENQLYQSPFIGFGDIRNNQTLITASEPFRFDIPLKHDNFTPKLFASLTWWVDSRNGIVIGIGSWDAASDGTQYGQMPTQGKINDVLMTRRSELSYANYLLGWRYKLFHFSNVVMYSKLAINELFDITYREEYVFHYLPGSEFSGFNKIASVQAKTSALFMLEYALGIEYQLGNWLNIGTEFGFLASERPVHLRHVQTRNDFASRDFVYLDTGNPIGAASDGTAGYLPKNVTVNDLADTTNPSASHYADMPLTFNGWQGLIHIGIDF